MPICSINFELELEVRFINKYNFRRSIRSSDLSKLGMLNVKHRVKQMRPNQL